MKADEPQFGQQNEDVERKREYYHIIIFPENTLNCATSKKRTSENNSNGTLQRRRGQNESGDKDSPSTKCQRPSRRAGERVEVSATSCPYDVKLSLKADEPQVSQRHEDVEKKREYYHIIIFPEKT